jgi:hypothetical protein
VCAARAGQPARVFREFRYATLKSWSHRRRVIGKAEHIGDRANPRFIVTSLSRIAAGSFRSKLLPTPALAPVPVPSRLTHNHPMPAP